MSAGRRINPVMSSIHKMAKHVTTGFLQSRKIRGEKIVRRKSGKIRGNQGIFSSTGEIRIFETKSENFLNFLNSGSRACVKPYYVYLKSTNAIFFYQSYTFEVS